MKSNLDVSMAPPISEETVSLSNSKGVPNVRRCDYWVYFIITNILFQYKPYKFVLLEALSATGLRAIRYAKEIPLIKWVSVVISLSLTESYKGLRYVIANDLSPAAVEVMRRNVKINGLADYSETAIEASASPSEAKVQINEADAWWGSYGQRFRDSSQCIIFSVPWCIATGTRKNASTWWTLIHMGQRHHSSMRLYNASLTEVYLTRRSQAPDSEAIHTGLLCVTCTDLSVLATTNYPEKWWVWLVLSDNSTLEICSSYSNYGGVPVKAEYCHEAVSGLWGDTSRFKLLI